MRATLIILYRGGDIEEVDGRFTLSGQFYSPDRRLTLTSQGWRRLRRGEEVIAIVDGRAAHICLGDNLP